MARYKNLDFIKEKDKPLAHIRAYLPRYNSLNIGKQKGFEIYIGWLCIKAVKLGKKFLFEIALNN